MVKRYLFFFMIGLLTLVGFHKGWNAHKQKSLQQKKQAALVLEEKPFVLIIPSYNNSAFVEKNLRSVFSQNYQNYRVIYIDDNSSDDTFSKTKKILAELHQEKRTTLIHNPQNQGALANIYNAIHTCKDQEIIVLIDGDDFLAHEKVLEILNQNYSDGNVWMTYGNFLDYPSYRQTPTVCKELPQMVIKKNHYRTHEWVTSHLRTFYASLFKKIHLDDLIYRGRFYPMGWDLAFMMPMLEMSGKHTRFIKEILYLYNRQNPLSDHRINFPFQQQCANHIRTKDTYNSLQELTMSDFPLSKKADILILSEGNPLQLYALLESIQLYVEGVGKISVIYPNSHFEQIKTDFPSVHFLNSEDFKSLCLKIVQDTSLENNPYLLLAQDDLLFKDYVNLSDSIDALEKTKAYGLFFSLGTHLTLSQDRYKHQDLPPLLPLKAISSRESVLGWQFALGYGDWKTAHPLDGVLYSREHLSKELATLEFNDPATLSQAWEKNRPQTTLGLFYAHSKSIKNSLSRDILEKFEQGLKIDIHPFFQVDNPSKRADQEIVFISR